MWFPKIESNLLEQYPLEQSGLLGLVRLQNFRMTSESLEVFGGCYIQHGCALSFGWAQSIKGEKCWTDEEVNKYRLEKPSGRSEQINAYRDSSFKSTSSFDYLSDWQHADFYIVQEEVNSKSQSIQQIEFERKRRSILLAIAILSEGTATAMPPLTFCIFKGSKTAGAISSRYDPPQRQSSGGAYQCDETSLRLLAQDFYEHKHPDSYLAALRFFRSTKRRSQDDRLLDVMIGLEALLNDGASTEISFKMGLRLSHLLDQTKSERRETSKIVRKAYEHRSKLVHGSKRQLEFLEERFLSIKKSKYIPLEDLVEISSLLSGYLVKAIKVRYSDYRDLDKDQLIEKLDDLAI